MLLHRSEADLASDGATAFEMPAATPVGKLVDLPLSLFKTRGIDLGAAISIELVTGDKLTVVLRYQAESHWKCRDYLPDLPRLFNIDSILKRIRVFKKNQLHAADK